MSVETVEVLVEGINTEIKAPFNKFNSCGLFTNGKWFNVAKKVPASRFNKGETYSLKIETNEKGYKTVVGFADELSTKATSSPIPSIPKTSVEDTPAPGGISPVAKAVSSVDNAGDKGLGQKLYLPASRDKSIETQAVLKSVLESPAYAQLVVGKKETEALEIGARMFEFFLERFYAAKG